MELVQITCENPIRVFPARTAWTPDDDMAFVGDPPLFRPGTPETPVLVSCTFKWLRAEALRLRDSWAHFYRDVRVGGPAFGDPGGEFVPGRFLKLGCRLLADRHYTRRPGSLGKKQFCYSGRKIVLRNAAGSILFVWMWPQAEKRMDGRAGYNCAIFRNESSREASSIILEAERFAVDRWGANHAYTFIDPAKLTVRKHHGAPYCPWPVGRVYLRAGWHFAGFTKSGKHVFEKQLA